MAADNMARPGIPLPQAGATLRSSLRRVRGVIPTICDASGYRLDERPLAMSGVRLRDLRAAIEGRRPLGFPTVATWREFQRDLRETLADAGLDDAAVRLGGSSRSFFSSPWARRPFPQDLDQLKTAIFSSVHNADKSPEQLEELYQDAADLYVRAGFTQDRPKPAKHFWDSRYLLHIDREPCDFDIELASDGLDRTLRSVAARWRAEHLGAEEKFHVAGSCQWDQDRVLEQFPALEAFKRRWTDRLGRTVDFECFDGMERLRFEVRQDWWRISGIE